MSRILTGDSQKLSFSTVTIVPLMIFRSDKPPRRTNYAHIACGSVAQPVRGLGLPGQKLSCVDKIYIFEILMKDCSKYLSPSQIG